MSAMFLGCTSLITLDLTAFCTSSVINMSAMFYKCINLTSLNLSSFNTENVTTMCGSFTYNYGGGSSGGMFENCSSLVNLDLSNFNTSKITNMSRMFYKCSRLTNLNLNSFDMSNVSNMSNMFCDCSKVITTICVNNVVTPSYVSIFSSAATDSSALITVNYIADTSTLVDNMIATKSASSHVVKGSLIS